MIPDDVWAEIEECAAALTAANICRPNCYDRNKDVLHLCPYCSAVLIITSATASHPIDEAYYAAWGRFHAIFDSKRAILDGAAIVEAH